MRFFLILSALCLPGLYAQESGGMHADAPTPQHQMLSKMVGTWNTASTYWMTPGAEPVKSEGSVNAKAILGGRFIMGWNKGEAMDMPYEGLSIIGYDTNKKAYTLSWRSSMDTSTVWGEGNYDEATKTLSFEGKMLSPMMDGSMVDYRFTTKFIDDNHLLDTMYMSMGGQEAKVMEIASERAK